MLLRLLPLSTPSQPSPPTILFTLPLPTHPYTSRSLPLPANLLAHRSVCLQEDVECPNVLLGEKSSWICGIVDDVTFSLPSQSITVHFIDDTRLELPLETACVAKLHRVINEVHLSLIPPQPDVTPRASTSSTASVSSTTSNASISSRRSTSSLLLSFLSPLLSNTNLHSTASSPITQNLQPPARVHRRQARSLLVDTYRQYVLPRLQSHLPSAYLPWAIASETARRLDDFQQLRIEINGLLALSGVDPSTLTTPIKRSRSSSVLSGSDADSSETDSSASPVTPATSIFSRSGLGCSSPNRRTSSPSPQAFLLSIPPAHALPHPHRFAYSGSLARLTHLVSRLAAIKKLSGRYEREEGKRRWLEGLERSRSSEGSLRRAFSNGQLKAVDRVNADPVKRSGLWRQWSAADQARGEEEIMRPAMMTIEEANSTSDGSDTEDATMDPIPRSPIAALRPSPRVSIPSSTLSDPFADPNPEGETKITETVIFVSSRPSLIHRNAEEAVPSLTTSRSDHSLVEASDWEPQLEGSDGVNDLLPPIKIEENWAEIGLGFRDVARASCKERLLDWEQVSEGEDIQVEMTSQGIELVVA